MSIPEHEGAHLPASPGNCRNGRLILTQLIEFPAIFPMARALLSLPGKETTPMKLSLNLSTPGKIMAGDKRLADGYGRGKNVALTSESVHGYERVLVRHAWVHVPTDSPIRYYAHPLRPMDRIQIFNEVWSHAHFDGQSWLVTARTRGNDPASLDAYLARLP